MPAVVAFLLGGVLVGPLAWNAARPSGTERLAGELRAADMRRDAEQIQKLTEQARQTRDELVPVLEGLAPAAPGRDGGPARPATAEQVSAWRSVTRRVVQRFENPPSGRTGTNLARAGITAAVDQLDAAVAAYAVAATLTGEARDRALAVVAEQRDLAVRTWSIGATQLDVVNVDAGYGHQHVFLPAGPGAGALTPDSEPEGSRRR